MAAGLVILGLAGAVLASALTGHPSEPLPGIALGSTSLLLVERAVAFFAAWMLVVVVVDQALQGRLPSEISGRGVRYADAETVGARQAKVERAARRHDVEIAQLREAVVSLDKRCPDVYEEID